MNKVYRVIWNHSLQCFVAASEFAKTKSKAASKVAAAIILSSVATTGFADENVIPKVVDSAMEETTTDSNTLPDLTEIAAIGAQVAAVMADNDLTLFDDTVVAETPVFTPGMGRAVGTNPVINIVVNGADAATASTGGWAISASERRTDGKGVIMAGLAAPIAMAIGSGANATGNGSVALGSFAATDTTAFGSVALGTYATTKGRAALAIGAGAYSNTASIALGGWSVATGLRANAIGVVSGAIGDDSTAIGTSSMASGLRSIALGSSPNTGSGADPVQDTTTNTNASGADSIALGTNAKASANNTLALGLNSSATLVNNLAVGANASATAANSVALGASSVANRANSVSIGGTGATRQLVNLSAGTTATDAANVSQLTPVIAALGGGSAFDNTTGAVTGPQYTLRQINATTGSSQSVSTPFSNVGDALTSLSGSLSNLSGSALRYVDSASKALIQLGGEDGTRITNLSTGELSASSTDAVNGSQLFATNNTVAANTATLVTHAADIAKNTANVSGLAGSLGGNAAVDVDGNFVAPSYSVQGQTLGTVGDALNALNGGVNTNSVAIAQNSTDILRNSGDITSLTTNLTNITNDLNSGSVGLVQQDADTLGLTVAAATGGTAVSLAGTDGARTLSGVNAGALAAGSTDAVNGSQLFATNNTVAANTATLVTHAADIAKNTANVSGLAGSLGGNAAVDVDGNFVAPSYSVQGQTLGTVGDALNALNGGVNTNSVAIAQNSTDILRNSGDITSLTTNLTNITNDLNSGSVGLVQQDADTLGLTVAAATGGTFVSLAGTDGARTLSGVNAGALAAGSTDAVNGSQLFATNNTVAANTATLVTHAADIAKNTANVSGLAGSLGGNAAVDVDGNFVAPSYSVQGQTLGTVGDALNALNGGVNTNSVAIAQNSTDILRNSGDITSLTTNLTNITNDLNSGSVGLVQQDADTLGLTVAAATGGTAVSLAGTDGARTLSGVKAGALAVGSTDAINGSQLFATNNNVAANTANIVTHTADIAKNTGNISGLAGSLGGGAAVDADGNFVAPSYSVQGQTVGTVGDALNALNGGVNTNTAVIAQNSTDILRNSGDINSLNNSMASMTNDLNSGSVGLVKQDLVSKELTVAALSGGDSISFSGLSGSRVLSGVRAGRADEDAVNISQLKDLFAELGATDASIDAATGKISGPRYNIQGRSYNLSDSLAALDTHIGTMKTNINNAIAYDLDNNNKVTLGNVNSLTRGAPAPVTITNLAEGNVAVGSTDAVNGNQLYEVKSQVTQNTSDISDIKNNIDGITNGTVGLVQQDAETQELSVGKDKGGTTVSLAGTEGDRVLTGIANGVADNDAATVAQVKDIAVASSTVATNNSSNRVKAVATGKDSTALGGGAQSSGDNSMALGSNARATASNSVALGNDSLADRANSVSIGSLGNERQITNVARGTAGTDAVNVDQFKEGLSSLSNSTNQNFRDMGRRMDDMKDKLSAGVASAMAMGSLPQPYSADAGMMSMGGGSYNGESALAIGASKVSENGKWVTKVQGSTNTQGDFGISAGVGYQW